jgi:hypothetical protein
MLFVVFLCFELIQARVQQQAPEPPESLGSPGSPRSPALNDDIRFEFKERSTPSPDEAAFYSKRKPSMAKASKMQTTKTSTKLPGAARLQTTPKSQHTKAQHTKAQYTKAQQTKPQQASAYHNQQQSIFSMSSETLNQTHAAMFKSWLDAKSSELYELSVNYSGFKILNTTYNVRLRKDARFAWINFTSMIINISHTISEVLYNKTLVVKNLSELVERAFDVFRNDSDKVDESSHHLYYDAKSKFTFCDVRAKYEAMLNQSTTTTPIMRTQAISLGDNTKPSAGAGNLTIEPSLNLNATVMKENEEASTWQYHSIPTTTPIIPSTKPLKPHQKQHASGQRKLLKQDYDDEEYSSPFDLPVPVPVPVSDDDSEKLNENRVITNESGNETQKTCEHLAPNIFLPNHNHHNHHNHHHQHRHRNHHRQYDHHHQQQQQQQQDKPNKKAAAGVVELKLKRSNTVTSAPIKATVQHSNTRVGQKPTVSGGSGSRRPNRPSSGKGQQTRGPHSRTTSTTAASTTTISLIDDDQEERHDFNTYDDYSMLDLYQDKPKFWNISCVNRTFDENFKVFPKGVNRNMSTVQVPTNVYNQELAINLTAYWTEALNEQFKRNYDDDNELFWQYFCSSHGLFRRYPGAYWTLPEREDFFDCRLQSWYIMAASSPKDVVILLDVSGSMTGLRLEIAKKLISSIMDTLTDNDFFNILTFSNKVS